MQHYKNDAHYSHSNDSQRKRKRHDRLRERMIQAAFFAAAVMAGGVFAARLIYEFWGVAEDKTSAPVPAAVVPAPPADIAAADDEQPESLNSAADSDGLILFFEPSPSPPPGEPQGRRHSSALSAALPALPEPEPLRWESVEKAKTKPKKPAAPKRTKLDRSKYSVRAIGQGAASVMPNDRSKTPAEVEKELNSARPRRNDDGKIVLHL